MRCFKWLVSLLHINLSIADDIVENNDQVIMPGLETGTFWVIGSMITTTIKILTGPSKIIFDYAELKYRQEMEICHFKVYI